jgi:DNA polymerase (family 10)
VKNRKGEAALTNAAIADRLALFSSLLELAEASPYAARAYRRAADLIRSLPDSAADLVRTGRIRELRGIGPGIEVKLRELVETGEIAELRELERRVEPELVALGNLVGLGARRTLEIGQALGITTAAELREALDGGRLLSVPGIGRATEARIRAGLDRRPRARRGLTLNRSRPLSAAIAGALDGEYAGEPRRFCELSYELAVVCATSEPGAKVAQFEALSQIVSVLERGDRYAVGLTVEGVPVRVVVCDPSSFGTELVRATGSDEYVRALEPMPPMPDEESLFASLGISYCPPELREMPLATPPPDLVEQADVRGDLHCHTTWSDGKATLREMAHAARERGHEYLAICDHTPNVRVVTGLTADDLRRQGEEIDELNELVAPFRVLRGVECDIRPDGTLDVEDDVLAELDWVQLSLHAGQRRARDELTRVVTEAMRNPYVRALSHPKGRILNHRAENALDLEEVFRVALETGVALEVNGLPDRLDLSAAHVSEALEAGVDLVLNSDAHSVTGLDNVELAVATARKGGAALPAVVNARSADQVASRAARG